jgi:hypothetical protein
MPIVILLVSVVLGWGSTVYGSILDRTWFFSKGDLRGEKQQIHVYHFGKFGNAKLAGEYVLPNKIRPQTALLFDSDGNWQLITVSANVGNVHANDKIIPTTSKVLDVLQWSDNEFLALQEGNALYLYDHRRKAHFLIGPPTLPAADVKAMVRLGRNQVAFLTDAGITVVDLSPAAHPIYKKTFSFLFPRRLHPFISVHAAMGTEDRLWIKEIHQPSDSGPRYDLFYIDLKGAEAHFVIADHSVPSLELIDVDSDAAIVKYNSDLVSIAPNASQSVLARGVFAPELMSLQSEFFGFDGPRTGFYWDPRKAKLPAVITPRTAFEFMQNLTHDYVRATGSHPDFSAPVFASEVAKMLNGFTSASYLSIVEALKTNPSILSAFGLKAHLGLITADSVNRQLDLEQLAQALGLNCAIAIRP